VLVRLGPQQPDIASEAGCVREGDNPRTAGYRRGTPEERPFAYNACGRRFPMSCSRYVAANALPAIAIRGRSGGTAIVHAMVVASLLAVGGLASAAEPAAQATAQPEAAPPTVAVGDPLPALPLRDQHDVEARVDASTRIVLFTRDMDGGGFVKEALAAGGNEMLKKAQAVYVSDVSRMPGFVRSAFALPSMRRREYRVVIDEGGTVTATLPYREGEATVLKLDGGKIAAVSFAKSAAEVAAALGK